MATYHRYRRPITNFGQPGDETKTVADWKAEDTKEPVIAFEDANGDIFDFTEYVAEFQIVHNDVDGDKAGRSKTKGARMTREYLGNKHTFNIKLVNAVPQNIVRSIYKLIHTGEQKTSFNFWHFHPCSSNIGYHEVYCSTINYGAQRYNRKTRECVYDGMNFSLIEM